MTAKPNMQHIYDERWRQNNPEGYKAANRRRAAKRSAASRILRGQHRDEYDALLAQLAEDGITGDARQREALRTLRKNHPTDWASARDAARQEVSSK